MSRDALPQSLPGLVGGDVHVNVRGRLPGVLAQLPVGLTQPDGRGDEEEAFPPSSLTGLVVDAGKHTVPGALAQRGDEVVGAARGCTLPAVGVRHDIGRDTRTRARGDVDAVHDLTQGRT